MPEIPGEVRKAMADLKTLSKEYENKNSQDDPVNHPKHYISPTGLESIEVIKAFTQNLRGFEAVATANVLKYLMRWENKNGIQDLEKARWYLDELIDYKSKKEFAKGIR